MSRCQFCKKKCAMPMTCKHCNLDLCISFYNPERHSCENLEKFIQDKKDMHIKSLQQSKCVTSKMEKI